MAGPKHMVAGFNHNVKHEGNLYHVQTEDYGLQNPRITTHLFVGGNIIATKSTSYAELVGAADLATTVRSMMEEQHKDMLRKLVAGAYDGRAEAAARFYQPGQLAEDAAAPADAPAPEASRGAPAARPVAPPARPPPTAQAVSAPTLPPPLPSAQAAPRPAPARPASFDPTAPAYTPPPVLRRQPGAPARATPPAPPARVPPPIASARPEGAPAPASPPAETLFAEDLISEKSLDEVILSYLAEELGGRK